MRRTIFYSQIDAVARVRAHKQQTTDTMKKLNDNQLAVLKQVKEAKKANFAVATANGGNGKTILALTNAGLVTRNGKKKESDPDTWSLTDAGKEALKPVKATKVAKTTKA